MVRILHVGTHVMRPQAAVYPDLHILAICPDLHILTICPDLHIQQDLGEVLLHRICLQLSLSEELRVYDPQVGLAHRLLTYAPWASPMAHVWNKRMLFPAVSNVCPKRASWRAGMP